MKFGLNVYFHFFPSTIHSHFLFWLTNFGPNLNVNSASFPFSNFSFPTKSLCQHLVSVQALARRASPGLDLTTALEQKWSTHVADLFAAHRPRSSTGQLHTEMGLKQQPIPSHLSFRLKDSLLSVYPSRVCLPPFLFSHHITGLCLW